MSFALLTLACAMVSAEPVKDFEAQVRKLTRGKEIDKKKLRAMLGQPHRIVRQIVYRRYLEQWIYQTGPGWAIQIDCPQGEKPRIYRVITPLRE